MKGPHKGTVIKLCGLTRPQDILAANRLRPDYVGFVFAPKSRRFVTLRQAEELRSLLDPAIRAVGVFVRERPEREAWLVRKGLIDLIQLHGNEGEAEISRLRELTDCPIIKAFSVENSRALQEAAASSADLVLLDSGKGGTGRTFDWECLRNFNRPCFLAGGLSPENAGEAIRRFHPYGVDVSSGIETDGRKDERKMAAFVAAVRKER